MIQALALLSSACNRVLPDEPLAPAPAQAPGAGNQAACTRYVEAFNQAPCAQVDLSASDLCPASLEELPCDLGEYYGCMAGAVVCRGDFLDISSQVNCSTPQCTTDPSVPPPMIPSGPPGPNRSACYDFVGAFNALPCNQVRLSPDDLCPASLDRGDSCAMAPYYGCMTEGARCRGDFLDVSGQTSCALSCP